MAWLWTGRVNGLSTSSSSMSMSMSTADVVSQSAYRLKEALYSPSGKLTLSPEIVVPEPEDPTALLLQASYVTKLSTDLRTKAKANAAFVSGSLDSVRQIVTEQEGARGSFPGPLPVVHCVTSLPESNDDDDFWEDVADAGGCAVLYGDGKALSSVAELESSSLSWMTTALSHGIQPIPEITLSTERAWTEDDVKEILEELKKQCGDDGAAPVCVVLSMDGPADDDDDEAEGDEEPSWWKNVPTLSKSLVSHTPVLGSVRTSSSQEALRTYHDRLKKRGFAGAFLRADCVPGFRLNPDLEFVASFWTAIVANLKSTRSKTFNGFRTKTALEKDVPMEWMKYQQNVMESGALGETSSQSSLDDLDLDRGDHYGF